MRKFQTAILGAVAALSLASCKNNVEEVATTTTDVTSESAGSADEAGASDAAPADGATTDANGNPVKP